MFKLLLVDDTKSVHAFVKELLRKRTDFLITDAFNGQEAINIIQSSESDFDLVLLDWEMPVKDGLDTLKNLRTMGSALPIIMMTTRNSPDDIAKILELGASEYLMKPFTADILFEKIEFALGKAITRAS
jgi:two-component system, chemotaxis family, chemotaxis protein CheY